MRVEKYGLALGRLWIRWPNFYWRDIWIGLYVPPSYWEGGEKKQDIYICIIPTIVLLLVIITRPK